MLLTVGYDYLGWFILLLSFQENILGFCSFNAQQKVVFPNCNNTIFHVIMSIQKESLPNWTHNILNSLSITHIRPQQQQFIDLLEKKVDFCVILPTGYGKSLCFALAPYLRLKPEERVSSSLSSTCEG